MWIKRLALLVIPAILAGTGGIVTSPTSAWAGEQHEPMLGDLNGDGIPDRATLIGSHAPCAVSVELGTKSGGYGPPTPNPFELPENSYGCPDLGAIVDLGGDGVPELVLGSWGGAFVGFDLIVLRDYQVVATMDGVSDPNVIEVGADFNGDGLLDLYEWSNQNYRLITLLNTPDGRLVRGPMWLPNIDRPDFYFADFDRNGASDMLVVQRGWFDYAVVVMLDDGKTVDLQRAPYDDDFPSWTAAVLDANKDGLPDVRTTDDHGVVTTFINLGKGKFVAAPVAKNDRFTVKYNKKKILDVRANDIASSTAKLSIITKPKYGKLIKDAKHELVYLRTAKHTKPDKLVYRLTEDGRSSTATVTLPMKGH